MSVSICVSVSVSMTSRARVSAQVKLGAHIDAANRDGSTPLMCAARFGRLQTARMLLELGADFRHCGNDGENVLDKAARGPPSPWEMRDE